MNKIIVGRILNTHGIKGVLKIEKTNDESFTRDIDYYLGDNLKKVSIDSVREDYPLVYIKFNEFDNINDVLLYKGQYIYIDEEDLEELKDDEFYIKDLIGLKVMDADKKELGMIKAVLSYAANDVYLVKGPQGELMVPAVKEFIKTINLDEGFIEVNLIEGMIDEDWYTYPISWLLWFPKGIWRHWKGYGKRYNIT